jgi:hypothetical protein
MLRITEAEEIAGADSKLTGTSTQLPPSEARTPDCASFVAALDCSRRLWQAACSATVSTDIEPSPSMQRTAPVGLLITVNASQTASDHEEIERRVVLGCSCMPMKSDRWAAAKQTANQANESIGPQETLTTPNNIPPRKACQRRLTQSGGEVLELLRSSHRRLMVD